MTGYTWVVPPDKAFLTPLALYEAAVRESVRAIALRRAPEIANWMKDNAPWTDRTGNARQSLYTEVEDLVGVIVVHLSHGVEYGKYLELSNAGTYAIIGPALDHWAPILWQDVKDIMR